MEEEPGTDPARQGRPRGASTVGDESATDPPSVDRRHDELRQTVVEALGTLPTQSKLVLLAVLAEDRHHDGGASTGAVYNAYEALCVDATVDALSQRRVTDLLDELDTFGLVSADVVSEGRYGRTRRIEGAVAPAPARDVLLADDHIGDVSVPDSSVGSDD